MTSKTIEGYEISVNALAAALICAGDDDVRPYLNGALMDFPNGRIVATDGHRMFVGSIERADCEPVNVPRELIALALKANKATKARDRLPMMALSVSDTDPDGEKVRRVTLNVVSSGAKFTDKAVDGTFPVYERVIPDKCSGEVAQFNTKYLHDAARALSTYAGQERAPYVDYCHVEHNGNSGAVVTNNTAQALVVLMPVRAGAAPDRAWFTGKDAEALAA